MREQQGLSKRSCHKNSVHLSISPGKESLMCVEGISKVASIGERTLGRKQATATFRCMQALVNAQARAAAQRIRMVEESQTTPQKQLNYRRSPQQSRFRHSFGMNENMEEFVKIVEMDLSGMRSNSKSRSSYSLTPTERSDLRFCSYNSATHTPRKADMHPQFSPAPSALTELSPRGCSGYFEEFSFATAQSSPHMSAMSMPIHNSFDYPLYPNYMANTESSRAKARSQSAPKQRLDAYERQSSRRRPSVEGRNIPRVIKDAEVLFSCCINIE
ncbi:hypothetical protein HPP92_007794 [Vanilla planifolia]|uniref:DUF4005 domain-containing protein n=1 Tax=Vanilla planifolia TaxID=51239 RepID=A0A835VC64_VANPL|nr:hypothetical protein HPP92_007794 [Vanilla planifolia]